MTGFGLFIDGTPLMPKYDTVLDDPRRHSLFFDQATLRFLRAFKPGATMNTEPAYPRMVQAGFYDGLGTLLPLGVYWFERVQSQGYQLWSIASCFDFIPLSRLSNPDDEINAYMHCLQFDRYADSGKAFRDYIRLRAMPDYQQEFFLPDYMITGDGEVIPAEVVRDTRPGFNPAKFRPRIGSELGGEEMPGDRWAGKWEAETEDIGGFEGAPDDGGFDLL